MGSPLCRIDIFALPADISSTWDDVRSAKILDMKRVTCPRWGPDFKIACKDLKFIQSVFRHELLLPQLIGLLTTSKSKSSDRCLIILNLPKGDDVHRREA